MSFPRYPAYKDSGVEWLGVVPGHWRVIPLKWSVRLVTEKAREVTHQIALENIEGWTGKWIDSSTEFSGDGIAFQEGDILFGKLRPYLAKVYLSEISGEAVGDFFVLRPESQTPAFLQKVLLSRPMIETISSSTIGAKMPRVTWDYMGILPIPTPPHSEQMAVARFLDHETAKIDALIQEQQRLIKLLKEKRQAVISHAVTKGLNPSVPMKDSGVEWLGEVPAHWGVVRFKHITRSIKAGPFGSALTKDMYTSSGYRVYGQEQVIPGDFKLGDYYISDEYYRELQQYSVEPQDILISCVGTFGKIAIVPADVEPGIINPRLIRVRVLDHTAPQFIEVTLKSSVVFEQFSLFSRGGTMDIINIATLSDIWLPIPPPSEQDVVVRWVESHSQRFDELIAEANLNIKLLAERRSALISAAVTGKIDVRNWQPPADESAFDEEVPSAGGCVSQ